MGILMIDGSQGEGGGQVLRTSLAGRGSFVTSRLTRHATTNIDVIRQFVDVTVEIARENDQVRIAIVH